jgi:hypothetical protein
LSEGGYLDWTRADGTLFRNTGACVSYVAHGGTLSPVTTITGTLTLFSIELNPDTPPGWCALRTEATGFPPGAYLLRWYEDDVSFLEFGVTIDATGTMTGSHTVADYLGPFVAQTRLFYGGVEVAASPVVACVPIYPEP